MYPVVIKDRALAELGSRLAPLQTNRNCYLLTDTNIAYYYLNSVMKNLVKHDFVVKHKIVPAGEQTKSLAVLTEVYQWLLAEGADRSSLLIALGGGVIGDLGGFVASTYMRGMPLALIPTTLLAQIDAGVGSKTAINFLEIKNVIGSFYDPLVVFIDPKCLDTLPSAELHNGLGELVKYLILLGDKSMQNKVKQKKIDAELIRYCVNYKLSIVKEDRTETGKRMILNCGHTIGHALESTFSLSHGQAVALGCIVESSIGNQLGLCSSRFVEELSSLCACLSLPTTLAADNESFFGQVLHKITKDKKRRGKHLNWVLPIAWGEVKVVTQVPDTIVERALQMVLN